MFTASTCIYCLGTCDLEEIPAHIYRISNQVKPREKWKHHNVFWDCRPFLKACLWIERGEQHVYRT